MGISWADSQAPAVLETRLPSAQQWELFYFPSKDFQNPADWGNFCCETLVLIALAEKLAPSPGTLKEWEKTCITPKRIMPGGVAYDSMMRR